MSKKVFLAILFLSFFSVAKSQDRKAQWVDSVFNTLNTHEKVGQLFMIPVSAYLTEAEKSDLKTLLHRYEPGSVLLTGGGPRSTAHLTNFIQSNSEIPVLTAIAGEWGLSQTLDSAMHFQNALVVSALKNDSLITHLGSEIAREMKALGIHMNFGLNADIHLEKQSYPTTLRYFGDNKERVARKSVLLLNGLKQGGVLTAAIHPAGAFLRSGEKQDSTLQLKVTELDTTGLYPYQQLVKAGLDAILTPYLHTQPLISKSTSGKTSHLFTTEILRRDLNFKGLGITDIDYLQTLAGPQKDGEIERLAFEVGNDVLINPKNLAAALKKISRAAKSKKQYGARLNEAVKKILAAKYDAGLAARSAVSTDNILLKLNSAEVQLLKHLISENAITMLNNQQQLLPIKQLENRKFLSVSFGKEESNEFTRYLSKYAAFNHRAVRLPQDIPNLQTPANEADVIVIGIFPLASSMIQQAAAFANEWRTKKEVIVVHFGNPLDLSLFSQCQSLIAGYTDSDNLPKMAAQIVFGAMPAKGELPYTVDSFKEGDGILSSTSNRLAYSLPEAAGVSSKTLSEIDAIAMEAIEIGATPGSHVLVAKDGKVIFEKSYGWLTYENKTPVTDETIYDLASVTKVSATLQTVMFMQERGLIDINKKAAVYLPELRDSNKKDFTIKDVLTHQSGLWPFEPFWTKTMEKGELLPKYYSNTSNSDYPFPVADGLFAHKAIKDSLWNWIIKARIASKIDRTPFDYRYSDMGFYIMQHLAEKMLNQPIEDFLEQNLYEPLGAYSLGYLPLNRFPASRIAPTEDDKLFRKKLLVGYVHDQGAAMHGGIAGHAGLFGTATDLAKLGQMLLQKGSYGGYQYYKPETVELFTTKQYVPSRRGLGWDKPTPSEWNGPTTLFASPKTFGHTGFTGTCIWMDPEFNLVFIYLSNRVHPDMTNNKLLNANIRPRIQEVIYKAIFDYCQY